MLAGPALLMTPAVLLLDMEIVLDTSLRKQVQMGQYRVGGFANTQVFSH
jgi:hypothetical protein